MKKSNKTNKETNIDEVLAEVEQAISKINNIDNLNLEEVDEKKLNKDIDLLETKLKLKYKDLLEDLTKK